MLLGNMYERYVHKRVESARPLRFKIVIPHWITRFGFQFRWFAIGILITAVVTEMSKIVVGRLRPHFIDVCDPDFSAINCTDVFGHPVYVTAYECRGKDSDVIRARSVITILSMVQSRPDDFLLLKQNSQYHDNIIPMHVLYCLAGVKVAIGCFCSA